MAIAVASTTLIATFAARFIVAFDIVWIQLATIDILELGLGSVEEAFALESA